MQNVTKLEDVAGVEKYWQSATLDSTKIRKTYSAPAP